MPSFRFAAGVDPYALTVSSINARINDIPFEILSFCNVDRLSPSEDEQCSVDVILAGDVYQDFYQSKLTERAASWLRVQADSGTLVLYGDSVGVMGDYLFSYLIAVCT